MDLRDEIAREAGGFSEKEWAALLKGDEFDAITVTNFFAIADRILALIERWTADEPSTPAGDAT